MKPLDCTMVSLFPQWVVSVAESGVVGRAVDEGLAKIEAVNPRDFTKDKHRTVDDRPYGGGPGMLMKVEPLVECIASIKQAKPDAFVVYASPQGEPLDDAMIDSWLAIKRPMVLVSGRYEGVDERFITLCVDQEVSLGDFVLSGGELACMAMFDAMVRKLPGALGHAMSATEDSFVDGRLDCPHYTRPEVYEDLAVPKVLTEGNHAAIAQWRLAQATARTQARRPDLLKPDK